MAKRKHLFHPDEVKAKIQASQLVNRLQDFVDSKIQMTPHQVTAALGLLRKAMPDLAATKHSGDAENPLVVTNRPTNQWLNGLLTTDATMTSIPDNQEVIH